MDNKKRHFRSRLQAGNAIVMLFAAIGMAGVVTYGLNNVMRGPATTTAELSRRSMAENNLIATTRLAISSATHQQTNGGDCDGDGFVEPIPYRDAGVNPHPVGGGWVPSSIGASMLDPWGTQYGYCVWDPGTVSVSDAEADCGGATPRRLEGAPRDDQYALAVVSAGKNGVFETECNAYADLNTDNIPDTIMLDKPAGSDDVVLAHTYAEANGIGGGEWSLDPGQPNTAVISKDLEVGNATTPRGASFTGALELGGARGLVLPRDPGDDSVTGACAVAKENQLRLNIGDGTAVPVLEICYSGAWTTVSGGTQVGGQCQPDYEAWTAQNSGTYDWEQISMSADGQVIVASQNDNVPIRYSHDGGVTWINSAETGSYRDFAVTDDGQVVYGTDLGYTISKSTDGGVTWAATGSPSLGWGQIDASADGTVVAAVVDGDQIYVSTDGGASWTARESVRAWWDIAVSADGTHMTAIPNSEEIYTSWDSGATWQARDIGRNWGASAMSADGSIQAATVIGGPLYVSTDSGATWSATTSSSENWWEIAVSADGTKILATTDGGAIHYSLDSGATWTESASGNQNWRGIDLSDDGTKVAVAVYNGVIHTSDPDCPNNGGTGLTPGGTCGGSRTWTAVGPTEAGYSGVDISDDGQVLIAASGDGGGPTPGGAYVSTDGGETWGISDAEGAYNGLAVTVSGDGLRMLNAQYNDTIRYSANSGANWAAVPGGTSQWASLSMSQTGMVALATVYSGGTTGSVWRSTDGGVTWASRTSTYSGANNAAAISGNGTRGIYTSFNGIDVSTDGGATWGNVVGGGVANFYAAGISHDGQVMAAGAAGGRVWVSTNGGTSWSQRTTLPISNWVSVNVSGDGQYIIAASEDEGVYLSSDSGNTWTQQTGLGNVFGAVSSNEDGSIMVAADTRIWLSICDGGGSSGTTSLKTPHPLDADLIAHWKMDEATGTTVADSEGNYDGTFIGTPYWGIEGPQGASSLQFFSDDTGVGNGVAINSDLGQLHKGTIALWANIENVDTGGGDLVNIDNTLILRHDSGEISFQAFASGSYIGEPTADIIYTKLFYTGWHYIVATFDDSTDGTLRLYIDGILINEALMDRITYSGSGQTRFGKNVVDDTNDFQGGLDDIRIYDRALGPAEVATLTERAKNSSTVRQKAYTSPATTRPNSLSLSKTDTNGCALMTDGTAWCWGHNMYGELGVGNNTQSDSPKKVLNQSIHNFTQISLGETHSCGVTSDGTGWCWGSDLDGQLGLGAGDNSSFLPQQVPGGAVWQMIVASDEFSCGVRTNGVVYCWGSDVDGQLGNGGGGDSNAPAAINDSGARYSWIDTSYAHVCGIRVDGSLWCWGAGNNGQIGDGYALTRQSPTAVFSNQKWKDVSIENDRSCGIATDGILYCWGDGDWPMPMPRFFGTAWLDIDLSTNHNCGIRIDGSAWCWGDDSSGQLGNGPTTVWTNERTPSRVLLPESVYAISAGYTSTCAFGANDALWCWGSDSNGQLGNGPTLTADQESPTKVLGFPAAPPWIWAGAHNAFRLNGWVTLGRDKWISDDGTAKYFGFESAGKARLRQTGSSNQLLIHADIAANSAQLSFGKAVATTADTTTGLTAEWLFNQTSGTNVPSNVGSFPGTTSGTVTWNPTGGRIATNGVLEFDGITGRVSVANNASLRPAGAFSVSLWVRPDNTQTDGATLLTKTHTNGANESYAVRFTGDNRVSFVTLATGSVVNELVSNVVVRPNAWTKIDIVATVSGGVTSKYILINGAQQGSSSTGLLMYDATAAGNLFFGSGGCASVCRPFRGAIDDVRLYTGTDGFTNAQAIFNYQTGFNPKTIGIDHSTNNLEIATNTSSTAATWLNTLTPDLALTSAGNMGVGTASPAVKADVAGGVRIGYESTACTTSSTGAVRFTGNIADEAPTYTCAGTSWTSLTGQPQGSFNGITYANGRFMAVANDTATNNVYTSINGTTWTQHTTGINAAWEGIAYGNGVWVAVGPTSGMHIMRSTDGVTWTGQAGTDYWWTSVTFANGVFVATAMNGATTGIMTSTDGLTWTLRTTNSMAGIPRAAYGNGIWVAIYNNGGIVGRSTDNGVTWADQTAATNTSWNSVTYGNSLFVAVSRSGQVMTSPNGITWTSRTPAAANDWIAVNYLNGIYVALAATGTNRIMTSTDGINWIGRPTPDTGLWVAAAYGAGRIVGVSSNAGFRYMVSTCTNATQQGTSSLPPGAIGYWKFDESSGAVAADSAGGNPGTLTGNATFSAGKNGNALTLDGVGDSANMGSAASLDNLPATTMCAWAYGPLPQPDSYSTIMGKTNATGGDGPALYTGDFSGLLDVGGQGRQNTWMEQWDLLSSNTWTHLCQTWGGTNAPADLKVYVNGVDTGAANAGGMNGGGGNDSSYDFIVGGTNLNYYWQGKIDEAVLYNRVLTPAEIQQVMNATSTSTGQDYYTCTNTPSWTSVAEATTGWVSVAYGNGTWVAIGYPGANRVMTSPDGITWTPRTAPQANSWSKVRFGNGQFVAVSYDGTNRVMTSPDGITWTLRTAAQANGWRSLAYGNGTWVAIAPDGTNRVMTSPDGITWTPQTAAEANSWQGIHFANGLFVAVSYDGTNRVMTSPDGVTWTPRAAAEANSWRSVTYGNGTWVATATSGTNRVMTSTDTVTWTPRTQSDANQWWSVTYGGGRFMALASSGANRAMTSVDGINWVASTGVPANQFWDVAYANGRFVSVSEDGTNRVATTTCPAREAFQYCDGSSWRYFGQTTLPSALWRRSDTKTVMDGSEQTNCGIRTNGSLYCWGERGQWLGINDNTSTIFATPQRVHTDSSSAGWTDWTQVSTGFGDSGATGGGFGVGIRTNGTAWAWGNNNVGQLGDGTSTNRLRPVQVRDSAGTGFWTDWKQVSAGWQYMCGIRANGTLWCWGQCWAGACGNGNLAYTQQTLPVQVFDTAGTGYWSDWTQVSVSGDHACGIRANGEAYCWGDNWSGVVGDGTTTDVATPSRVLDNAGGAGYWSDWKQIVTGPQGVCGLRNIGQIYCWGMDTVGAVGDGGGNVNTTRPGTMVANSAGGAGWSDWAYLGDMGLHVCAIRSNGAAYCWGEGGAGQGGNGSSSSSTYPQQVLGASPTSTCTSAYTNWVSINAAGLEASCGVRSDGTSYCWGNADSGTLGTGLTTPGHSCPQRMLDP